MTQNLSYLLFFFFSLNLESFFKILIANAVKMYPFFGGDFPVTVCSQTVKTLK